MYNYYLLQLEEAGKIRNLKQRTIDGYKSVRWHIVGGTNRKFLTLSNFLVLVPML